jgi:hypothetical protein
MKMRWALISLSGIVFMIPGCQENTAPDADAAQPVEFPEGLPLVGTGYPNPGDACRVVGESAATADFLDDSATLVGCLETSEADRLGGRTVGTIEGVTLVSVPLAETVSAEGPRDAMVPGTNYNAVAQVKCTGYKGAGEGLCEAGVNRMSESGPYIDVTLADGTQRTLLFDAQGGFLTFSTAEADGTAAMAISSTRIGDTTVATLGSERYEIPDAFVRGG